MQDPKTPLNPAQVQNVLKELFDREARPGGAHLSDADAIAYVQQSLPPEDAARLEQHMESCPECALSIERLLEAADFYSSAAGVERLAAMRQTFKSHEPSRGWFWSMAACAT